MERGEEGAYSKVLETVKFGGLHNGVQHGLNHKADVFQFSIREVQSYESLQEADHNDEEQCKEDERFPHHDLQNDQHGAEEAESVEVQQQAHPEHGRCEGQEVVAEFVEVTATSTIV